MLASGNKPDNISNGYLITLIAKYYFDRGKDPNILIDTVKAKMLEFNIEGYQEYRYANKIKKTCIDLYDSESKNLFRELEYVPIYEKELKVVESLPNDRQKKFMFTLFAIARYMNSEGWINKKDSKGLSEVFKLLGDITRTQILWVLDKNEMCVCDIANVLNMTKSSISHQLAVLRKSGIVKCRREGKEVYYMLDDEHIKKLYEIGIEHINHKLKGDDYE